MDQKKTVGPGTRVLRIHRVCCDKLFAAIAPKTFDGFFELNADGQVLFPVGLARDGEELSLTLQTARYCPYCGTPIATPAVWQTVH